MKPEGGGADLLGASRDTRAVEAQEDARRSDGHGHHSLERSPTTKPHPYNPTCRKDLE